MHDAWLFEYIIKLFNKNITGKLKQVKWIITHFYTEIIII